MVRIMVRIMVKNMVKVTVMYTLRYFDTWKKLQIQYNKYVRKL